VLNDDYIAPNNGFEMHPHKNFEIITYVIDGAITHKDTLGNERTVTTGNIQYQSAGTGISHSEFNHTDTEMHILQL